MSRLRFSRFDLGLAFAALLACAVIVTAASAAAPKANLWERWTTHDPASTRSVDHSGWGAFLRRYLRKGPDGVNRVAYGEVDEKNRKLLRKYIEDLSDFPVRRLNRKEQLAFWINLYNAVTVELILDHYPLESILELNISPGWFTVGPWGKKLVSVEGEKMSLDDIEHRVLRPIWRDPRIHYAVNCASYGCPNLAAVPFTAESADALLEAGARAYVNHPRGALVEDGELTVSSIYHWYKVDFGGTDAGVIAHLKKYAAPPLAAKLKGIRRIDDHEYDWKLNDAR